MIHTFQIEAYSIDNSIKITTHKIYDLFNEKFMNQIIKIVEYLYCDNNGKKKFIITIFKIDAKFRFQNIF